MTVQEGGNNPRTAQSDSMCGGSPEPHFWLRRGGAGRQALKRRGKRERGRERRVAERVAARGATYMAAGDVAGEAPQVASSGLQTEKYAVLSPMPVQYGLPSAAAFHVVKS